MGKKQNLYKFKVECKKVVSASFLQQHLEPFHTHPLKQCIINSKMSTCTASKITCQDFRTSGKFRALNMVVNSTVTNQLIVDDIYVLTQIQ